SGSHRAAECGGRRARPASFAGDDRRRRLPAAPVPPSQPATWQGRASQTEDLQEASMTKPLDGLTALDESLPTLSKPNGVVGDAGDRKPQRGQHGLVIEGLPIPTLELADGPVTLNNGARHRHIELRAERPRKDGHGEVISKRAVMRTLEVEERDKPTLPP